MDLSLKNCAFNFPQRYPVEIECVTLCQRISCAATSCQLHIYFYKCRVVYCLEGNFGIHPISLRCAANLTAIPVFIVSLCFPMRSDEEG